jgi:hypothetical protein
MRDECNALNKREKSSGGLRTTDFSATFLYTAAPEPEARIFGKLLMPFLREG